MKSKKVNFFFLAVFLVIIVTPDFARAQIRNPKGVEQEWETDTTKRTIALDALTIVLKRNQIEPINTPRFIDKKTAEKNLIAEQPVLAISLDGEARAYPLAVLSFHEIVNHEIAGIPVAASYCPLCNSSIVFKRRVKTAGEKRTLTFGTSGMLRKSNLVMWDEETETWWQQFTGNGIVGELAGSELEMLPAMVISMADFLQDFPEGKVLWPESDKSGERDYTKNVYQHYDSLGNTNPRLFFGEVDNRLPAMARVIDAHDGNTRKVYPLSLLKEHDVVNDVVGDKPVAVFYDPSMLSNLDTKAIADAKHTGSANVFHAMMDGKRLTFAKEEKGFRDKQSGSLWTFTGKCIDGAMKGKQLQREIYGHHFAFSWFAFYPESSVYKSE